MSFCVVVPTYEGGDVWKESALSIYQQSIKPTVVLCVDSSSCDATVDISSSYGFDTISISKFDFNHGGTRNLAVKLLAETEFIIFMTQDAILDDEFSFSRIIACFDDPDVAAVCGRQLPHCDANPLARHARTFNYPAQSRIKSFDDCHEFGLKVAFMSNSFSAYRKDVFDSLGGFPENTILAEDMYIAAKMILAGYKVAYCAEATVRHSHNYSPWDEFRRYFDTGVFHACEPWVQEKLGGASGEGARFVKSELLYLLRSAPLWIPRAVLTTACKLLGYKLGKNYRSLPKAVRSTFGMYKSYWLQQSDQTGRDS